ncbi:MAG: (Fe-S)-binding protein [Cyclobacteriaceae bacterium]
MDYLPQIIFLLLVGVTAFIMAKRIGRISKTIKLGRPLDRSDNPGERLKVMTLVAFGQKKMFKRIVPAILHLFLYVGFILINIEVLEIILDGLIGTHRLFAEPVGHVYGLLINFFEFLAVAVIVACVIFLIRRNLLPIRRFKARELTAWPKLDANLILVIEILLMLAILTMNATDQILQTRVADLEAAGMHIYPVTGALFFSSWLIPLFEGMDTQSLVILERAAWWFHIVGIFAFAIYVTYSKHLHIFLAFPNTYYSNLNPKGEMRNMDEVTNEVKMMLGMPVEGADQAPPAEIARFGAKDINDLTWKNIMDSYSCTECGRCSAECPANLTGRKLSPRKIMMDTRDRAEEVGASMDKGGKGLEDGKTLLDDYIQREELMACTTCNACVEACPVNIDPLSIILQMRRYITMEESKAPASWNAMYSNIETSMAPWKFPPTDRFNWAADLKKETSTDK